MVIRLVFESRPSRDADESGVNLAETNEDFFFE
jgi:hypothetical protein